MSMDFKCPQSFQIWIYEKSFYGHFCQLQIAIDFANRYNLKPDEINIRHATLPCNENKTQKSIWSETKIEKADFVDTERFGCFAWKQETETEAISIGKIQTTVYIYQHFSFFIKFNLFLQYSRGKRGISHTSLSSNKVQLQNVFCPTAVHDGTSIKTISFTYLQRRFGNHYHEKQAIILLKAFEKFFMYVITSEILFLKHKTPSGKRVIFHRTE